MVHLKGKIFRGKKYYKGMLVPFNTQLEARQFLERSKINTGFSSHIVKEKGMYEVYLKQKGR